MVLPKLILASGSPQRRQLLTDSDYDFEIIVPDDSAEDCGICTTGGPAHLVTDLALRKAADVAGQIADQEGDVEEPTLIIACDTVAECNGSVLGKPRDEDHARDMLLRLRGQQQRVFSGLCLWPMHFPNFEDEPLESESLGKNAPQTHLAVSELRMDPIEDDDLDEYLASGLWQGKAGAFGYQDRVGWLHILSGSESNVIGLPMELLEEELTRFTY